MAATPSTMLPLGTIAPDFELLDVVAGEVRSLNELKAVSGTVIMFICNHCPYVVHVMPEILRLCDEYQDKGIQFIAISSNDVSEYPDDSPEKMREHAEQWGNRFPYLYDASQDVAKAYQAACTPDFYLFDKNLACVYRGRLDESTPRNEKALNGADLRAALEALLTNQVVSEAQYPSIGCNIKWKA